MHPIDVRIPRAYLDADDTALATLAQGTGEDASDDNSVVLAWHETDWDRVTAWLRERGGDEGPGWHLYARVVIDFVGGTPVTRRQGVAVWIKDDAVACLFSALWSRSASLPKGAVLN